MWLKWGKNIGHFTRRLSVLHIARSDVCSATIQSSHGCPSMPSLSIFVDTTDSDVGTSIIQYNCCVSVATAFMQTRKNDTLYVHCRPCEQLQHNCVQVSFKSKKSGAYRRLLQYSHYSSNRCVCVRACRKHVNNYINIYIKI
jgi:hypothetical protein